MRYKQNTAKEVLSFSKAFAFVTKQDTTCLVLCLPCPSLFLYLEHEHEV